MRRTLLAVLFFVALVAIWAALVHAEIWSPVLLPSPRNVVDYLVTAARDGSLFSASAVTLRRLLVGYFIGLAIGLPLALLFLGLLARSLDTRRHQAAAAVLLGLVVLSHIFTTLFALAGAAVIALIRPSRRRFLDAAFVVAAGGLLAGFWLVPLRFRYGYAPPGLHDHVGKYFQNLFPFASR